MPTRGRRGRAAACSLRLWLVAQAVEGDAEDAFDLSWVGSRDLADSDHQLNDLGDRDVWADDASVLGALEEGLACCEERGAAGLEELGVLVEVVEQLVGERALGREIGHEAVDPGGERLPGVGVVEFGGGAADLLDVEGLEECLAVREVAVERADPDTGAPCDLLKRDRFSTLGERLAGGGEDLLVVAPCVRALRPRDEYVGGGVGRSHGFALTSGGCLRIVPEVSSSYSGGSLHFSSTFRELGVR